MCPPPKCPGFLVDIFENASFFLKSIMGTLSTQKVPKERLALYIRYAHCLILFLVTMHLAQYINVILLPKLSTQQ